MDSRAQVLTTEALVALSPQEDGFSHEEEPVMNYAISSFWSLANSGERRNSSAALMYSGEVWR